ncbi:MAG: alpha/beta hydrolase-fold protein [Chloroflexota bacterium]
MQKIVWMLILVCALGLSACATRAGAQMQVEPSPAPGGTLQARPLISPTAALPPTQTSTAHAPATTTSTPTARPLATKTPTNTATATPLACLSQGGRIETDSLRTLLLRLPMDYRVYVPPCYDQQTSHRYPVLYLIHGQSYNDDQWDRLGVDETIDRLVEAGQIAPFIVVMPRDRYGGQPSENNFAQVVVNELMPLIDSEYRTIPERSQRAVGGLSRGAGWAVHLAFVYWEQFGALGAHSPAIFYDDAQRMRVYLDTIPPEQYPRLYVDVGDKDRPEIMDVSLWFEKLLNEWDVPHEWHLFSGYHEEAYWQVHVETYLRWYAQDWSE